VNQTVELEIGGMTCASCAARIEKRLNRMPGVEASVNYSTEKAKVALADGATVDGAIATVEATGYTAHLREPQRPVVEGSPALAPSPVDEAAPLRRRLVLSAVLTAPVLALAMIEPLQFDNWQWLSLTMAAPVVVWGAWPFHRHYGHFDQHRSACCIRVVPVCAVLRDGWCHGDADGLQSRPPARRRIG